MNKNTNLEIDVKTVSGFSSALKSYTKSITHLLNIKYNITPEEFFVSTMSAIKKTPKLLQCDPASLFGSILLSAELGLKFNTPEQHAYIIPYNGQAQFQIGYRGLVHMMYRNPRILSLRAEDVFEKDVFEYELGLKQVLIHKPYRKKDRGKLTAVYIVCQMEGAEPFFTVVEGHILKEVENLSQAKNSKFSPYNNGTDIHNFMQKKVAVKKLSKLMPKSALVDKIIDIDSKIEVGAVVKANLPENANEVIEAKLISTKNMDFDSESQSKEIEEATEVKEPVVREIKSTNGNLDFSHISKKQEEDINKDLF